MKTRLTLIFAVAFAMMPAMFFGQAAFDKFEQDQNFTTVTVNKKAFAMLANVQVKGPQEETKRIKELAQKIESFKVVTTEKRQSTHDLKSVTDKYIKSAKLDELRKVREKGTDFRVMVKTGADASKISEILVFAHDAGDASAVTVIVKGLFDLDELSELTEKVLPKATDSKVEAKLSDVTDALVLKVSPNPASGVFYINAKTPTEVKLYDATGRLVKSQTYTSEGVSTSGITPGTYVVEINTDGRRQTQQLIIK